MSHFPRGTRCELRLGYWDDHQIVTAYVLKTFLFMRLVQWLVRESWDGTPPFSTYDKTKWVPVWRLIKLEIMK